MRINEFYLLLEKHNISCSDTQLEKFNKYMDLLLEWNKKINLTSITDPKEIYIKHFFDSLTPSFYFNFTNQRIIDIGAGAGFPSIPLKICFPDIQLTLLDSLKKRLSFLDEVANELNLNHVETIHGRAEDLANTKQKREVYDVALARAVAKLNVLTELTLPFIRLGGRLIALKGQQIDDEVYNSKKGIKTFGGELEEIRSLNLPEEYGERNIVIIKKIKKTPSAYPRKAGTPSKKPII